MAEAKSAKDANDQSQVSFMPSEDTKNEGNNSDKTSNCNQQSFPEMYSHNSVRDTPQHATQVQKKTTSLNRSLEMLAQSYLAENMPSKSCNFYTMPILNQHTEKLNRYGQDKPNLHRSNLPSGTSSYHQITRLPDDNVNLHLNPAKVDQVSTSSVSANDFEIHAKQINPPDDEMPLNQDLEQPNQVDVQSDPQKIQFRNHEMQLSEPPAPVTTCDVQLNTQMEQQTCHDAQLKMEHSQEDFAQYVGMQQDFSDVQLEKNITEEQNEATKEETTDEQISLFPTNESLSAIVRETCEENPPETLRSLLLSPKPLQPEESSDSFRVSTATYEQETVPSEQDDRLEVQYNEESAHVQSLIPTQIGTQIEKTLAFVENTIDNTTIALLKDEHGQIQLGETGEKQLHSRENEMGGLQQQAGCNSLAQREDVGKEIRLQQGEELLSPDSSMQGEHEMDDFNWNQMVFGNDGNQNINHLQSEEEASQSDNDVANADQDQEELKKVVCEFLPRHEPNQQFQPQLEGGDQLERVINQFKLNPLQPEQTTDTGVGHISDPNLLMSGGDFFTLRKVDMEGGTQLNSGIPNTQNSQTLTIPSGNVYSKKMSPQHKMTSSPFDVHDFVFPEGNNTTPNTEYASILRSVIPVESNSTEVHVSKSGNIITSNGQSYYILDSKTGSIDSCPNGSLQENQRNCGEGNVFSQEIPYDHIASGTDDVSTQQNYDFDSVMGYHQNYQVYRNEEQQNATVPTNYNVIKALGNNHLGVVGDDGEIMIIDKNSNNSSNMYDNSTSYVLRDSDPNGNDSQQPRRDEMRQTSTSQFIPQEQNNEVLLQDEYGEYLYDQYGNILDNHFIYDQNGCPTQFINDDLNSHMNNVIYSSNEGNDKSSPRHSATRGEEVYYEMVNPDNFTEDNGPYIPAKPNSGQTFTGSEYDVMDLDQQLNDAASSQSQTQQPYIEWKGVNVVPNQGEKIILSSSNKGGARYVISSQVIPAADSGSTVNRANQVTTVRNGDSNVMAAHGANISSGGDANNNDGSQQHACNQLPHQVLKIDPSNEQIGQPKVARLVSVNNSGNKVTLPITVTDYKFIQRRRQNRSYRNHTIRITPNSPKTLLANAEKEHAFILEYQNRSKRRNNASVKKKIEFYERELKWLRGVRAAETSRNPANGNVDSNGKASNSSAVVHLKINNTPNSTVTNPEKIIDCNIEMSEENSAGGDMGKTEDKSSVVTGDGNVIKGKIIGKCENMVPRNLNPIVFNEREPFKTIVLSSVGKARVAPTRVPHYVVRRVRAPTTEFSSPVTNVEDNKDLCKDGERTPTDEEIKLLKSMKLARRPRRRRTSKYDDLIKRLNKNQDVGEVLKIHSPSPKKDVVFSVPPPEIFIPPEKEEEDIDSDDSEKYRFEDEEYVTSYIQSFRTNPRRYKIYPEASKYKKLQRTEPKFKKRMYRTPRLSAKVNRLHPANNIFVTKNVTTIVHQGVPHQLHPRRIKTLGQNQQDQDSKDREVQVDSDLDASFGDPCELVQNINEVGKSLLQNPCGDLMQPQLNKPQWQKYVYPPLSQKSKDRYNLAPGPAVEGQVGKLLAYISELSGEVQKMAVKPDMMGHCPKKEKLVKKKPNKPRLEPYYTHSRRNRPLDLSKKKRKATIQRPNKESKKRRIKAKPPSDSSTSQTSSSSTTPKISVEDSSGSSANTSKASPLLGQFSPPIPKDDKHMARMAKEVLSMVKVSSSKKKEKQVGKSDWRMKCASSCSADDESVGTPDKSRRVVKRSSKPTKRKAPSATVKEIEKKIKQQLDLKNKQNQDNLGNTKKKRKLDHSSTNEDFRSPTRTPKKSSSTPKRSTNKQKVKLGRPRKVKDTEEVKNEQMYVAGDSPLDLSTKRRHFFYQDQCETEILPSSRSAKKRLPRRKQSNKESECNSSISVVDVGVKGEMDSSANNSVTGTPSKKQGDNEESSSLNQFCNSSLELTCENAKSDSEEQANNLTPSKRNLRGVTNRLKKLK